MQALILVGGMGTRLRPLTSTVPKLVVPLVDRPFIAYMLQWLRRHGVVDVILACGFMADEIRRVLGDGASMGLSVRYVEEPAPLGTGGALKYAEDLLEDRFLVLNGDVLTDIDLTAQLRAHEGAGASATLALVPVPDPSAYGLVRRNPDGSVRGFVEKPSPEEIDTNLINAGAYVLERSVLDEIGPAGTSSSIERDVFPKLVGNGLFGYEADGYWMDIGTPERYLQGTYDILDGAVETGVGALLGETGVAAGDGAIEGELAAPVLVGSGARVAPGARIGPRSVLGAGVTVEAGAVVERSVVLDGATIGADSRVCEAIVGPHAAIGRDCRIDGRAVIGAGATIGAGNVLSAGVRIFPGVVVPSGAVAF